MYTTTKKDHSHESRERDWIFDGSRPEEFAEWKDWAWAALHAPPTNIEKKSWGMKLYGWLGGEARRMFREVSTYYCDDGWDIMLRKLEDRYPIKTKQTRKLEVMEKLWRVSMHSGEDSAAYTGRFRGICDEAAHYQISLGSEIRGFMLMHGAGITQEQRAILLAASLQDINEDKVAHAMRNVFPKGFRNGAAKAYAVMTADGHQAEGPFPVNQATTYAVSEPSTACPEDSDGRSSVPESTEEFFDANEEVDDILAAAEVDALAVTLDKDEYTEEEATMVLANWKEKRETINKVRLSRGFGPLHAAPSNMRQLVSRVKCWHCGQKGHFKKDCKSPRTNQGTAPRPAPKAQGRVGFRGGRATLFSTIVLSVMCLASGLLSPVPRFEQPTVVSEKIVDRFAGQVPKCSDFRNAVVTRFENWTSNECARQESIDRVRESLALKDVIIKDLADYFHQSPVPIPVNNTNECWYDAESGDTEEFAKICATASFFSDIECQCKSEVSITESVQSSNEVCCFSNIDVEANIPLNMWTVCFADHLGYGILDTGCGKFVAGQDTMTPHLEVLKQKNIPYTFTEANQVFRFGNGETLTAGRILHMPVGLAGRHGIARIYLVPGSGPVKVV